MFKRIIKTTPETFIILKDSVGTLLFSLFIALASLILGACFLFVVSAAPPINIGFQIFGALFSFIGLFLLMKFPSLLKRTRRDGGYQTFKASSEGLSLSPEIGALEQKFRWEQVERIIVCGEFRQHTLEGITSFPSGLVIVFSNFHDLGTFELAKRHMGRLKTSEAYLLIGYPKKLSTSQMKLKLREYVPDSVEIKIENIIEV